MGTFDLQGPDVNLESLGASFLYQLGNLTYMVTGHKVTWPYMASGQKQSVKSHPPLVMSPYLYTLICLKCSRDPDRAIDSVTISGCWRSKVKPALKTTCI